MAVKTMWNHKLRILILHHLAHGAHSGYQLIKEIKEETGWKPSYGSIYPLLDTLLKEGLVTSRVDGRRKLYTLTAKGKKSLAEFLKQHEMMIAQAEQAQKLLARIFNLEEDSTIMQAIPIFHDSDKGVQKVVAESLETKKEIAKLYVDGRLRKHHARICALMNQLNKELRKLK